MDFSLFFLIDRKGESGKWWARRSGRGLISRRLYEAASTPVLFCYAPLSAFPEAPIVSFCMEEGEYLAGSNKNGRQFSPSQVRGGHLVLCPSRSFLDSQYSPG